MTRILCHIVFCLWFVSCVTQPPIQEMALADATLKHFRNYQIPQKDSDRYNRATFLLERAKYHFQKQEYAKARDLSLSTLKLLEESAFSIALRDGGLQQVLEVESEEEEAFDDEGNE